MANILEGSVRKQGDRMRITAQLLRASDGFRVWSDTYDGTLADIFLGTGPSKGHCLSVSEGNLHRGLLPSQIRAYRTLSHVTIEIHG